MFCRKLGRKPKRCRRRHPGMPGRNPSGSWPLRLELQCSVSWCGHQHPPQWKDNGVTLMKCAVNCQPLFILFAFSNFYESYYWTMADFHILSIWLSSRLTSDDRKGKISCNAYSAKTQSRFSKQKHPANIPGIAEWTPKIKNACKTNKKSRWNAAGVFIFKTRANKSERRREDMEVKAWLGCLVLPGWSSRLLPQCPP